MISRLTLKNFTVFAHADIEFAPGLNVIVGENATGKSHILKVAYGLEAVLADGFARSGRGEVDAYFLKENLGRKLRGVFQVDQLAHLISKRRGVDRCEIAAEIGGDLSVWFPKKHRAYLRFAATPREWAGPRPVFLPPRELLSSYPGFVSLFETRAVSFDETWRDTCLLLGLSRLVGDRLAQVRPLWEAVEADLGGEIHLTNDRFSLITKSAKIDAPLMAEGQRKLGMVAQLIANGALVPGCSLFWDEPEANLNAKVIKQVARTILQLCRWGVQTVMATHSLFLLRELDILLRSPEFPGLATRFIGLHPEGSTVAIDQGETVDDIGKITALQEELIQSDRYLKLGID